jgi:hypothetical protein
MDAEDKTAHEVRRLRASVRDLQNGALVPRNTSKGRSATDG